MFVIIIIQPINNNNNVVVTLATGTGNNNVLHICLHEGIYSYRVRVNPDCREHRRPSVRHEWGVLTTSLITPAIPYDGMR